MSTKKRKTVPKKKKLTPKQERFCLEYQIDFNNTRAAIRAGYSAHAAANIGWELVRNPQVSARIMELRNKTADDLNLSKESLMQILREIAGAKVEDITDPETGAILPPSAWPDHMKGVVSGLETDEVYLGRGEDRQPIGTVKKVKLWEKTRAIEQLSRMLGFNAPEKVAQTTPDGKAALPVINVYTTPPKSDD